MSAVDKADIEFLFAELFQDFLFAFADIPDKTEIAADYEGIALFEFFDCRRIEAVHIAVHISCYIYHKKSTLPGSVDLDYNLRTEKNQDYKIFTCLICKNRFIFSDCCDIIN